jgi:hypothetical protein
MFSAMGIFNFSSTSAKDQNQTPLTIVEPVLTSLGLTQDDINSHNKNLMQQDAIKYGASYYKNIAQEPDITSASPIKLGPIALNTNTKEKSDLVDSLAKQITQMKAVMSPADFEKIEISLEGFATGLGQTALEAKDWQTAVKALDSSTPDGIEKNTELLTKLGQMFAADKEIRIAIANLIQERINNRSSKTNQTQEASQQPIQRIQTPTTPPAQIDPTPVTLHPTQPAIQPVNLDQPYPAVMPAISMAPTPIVNMTSEKLSGEITDSSGVILRPVPKMPGNMANLTS